MTDYDYRLPFARKLVKGLVGKLGVHIVDKEAAANFLAQAMHKQGLMQAVKSNFLKRVK